MNNPDESWDFFVTKFSKSLRNSVKILNQFFKIFFILELYLHFIIKLC